MKRFLVVVSALIVMAVAGLPGVSSACVGKTLVIGSVDIPSVNMVSEMMSILITERTGTTVVVNHYPDYAACYAAAKEGVVDIVVDFTGRGYVEVLKKAPETDAGKVFQAVKEDYERELNMIWLGLLGFSESSLVGGDTPAMASTIIRKETMDKFPALPRVLDKLTGKLDNATVAGLVKEIGTGSDSGKKAQKVTRKYLKTKRII